jgi:hypothetical protein
MLDNAWQHLKLEKTDPNDRHSSWTISKDGHYLEFIQQNDSYQANKCDYRRSEGERQSQEWYIGCVPGREGFMSVHHPSLCPIRRL